MNDGVIMLRSYYEAIKTLSKRDQNLMYSSIFEYVFEGIVPELPPKLVPIWTLMKPNLDSSARRYTASKSNSFKGGRPRKESSEKNLSKKPTLKPTHIIDKDKDKDMDKEKDIYIYSPAALLSQLTEEERQSIEELTGDKMEHLMRSIGAWLSAGHETSSLYNTCLTFIRNSPREFKGKPVEVDPAEQGWHYEDEPEFIIGADGYETAIMKRYKVYDDGRREKID